MNACNWEVIDAFSSPGEYRRFYIRSGKDLTVQGSNIVGTNDVKLAAAGNVTITTSQDTQNTSSMPNGGRADRIVRC